jgi:hypothetical protein
MAKSKTGKRISPLEAEMFYWSARAGSETTIHPDIRTAITTDRSICERAWAAVRDKQSWKPDQKPSDRLRDPAAYFLTCVRNETQAAWDRRALSKARRK